MLAQSPNDYTTLHRSLMPAMKSSIVGDLAVGTCYVAAIASCILGRYVPDEVKTIALMAATGAATAQYFANSDEDAVNAAIANDALRETELRNINNQLMDRQGVERSQAEIQAQITLLHQIAQAPKALQPLLLQQNGFDSIIPLLQDAPAAKPTAAMKTAQTWDEETEPEKDLSWLNKIMGFPAILIFGPQGSGKTTLVEYILKRRHELGHEIEVLDPHRAAGAWEGLSCYGDGMNYAEVDSRLKEFEKAVKGRYEIRSRKKNFNPKPRTVMAEEMTNWGDRCENAEAFLKTSLSDNRKIKMHALFVSHGRELALLGNSKGTSKMRDNGLLEIQLSSEASPTGQPRPTGTGKIRWPGTTKWEDIDIPDLSGFKFSIEPDAAEEFADDSGISGDLETEDRVDDTADLTNLRLSYQEAKKKPSGQELLEQWNAQATTPLDADSITGLLQICEMSDAEFQVFLEESLT